MNLILDKSKVPLRYPRNNLKGAVGLGQGSANYGPQHLVINKVLLKHSQLHLFMYCLGLLCATPAKLNSYNINYVTHKA